MTTLCLILNSGVGQPRFGSRVGTGHLGSVNRSSPAGSGRAMPGGVSGANPSEAYNIQYTIRGLHTHPTHTVNHKKTSNLCANSKTHCTVAEVVCRVVTCPPLLFTLCYTAGLKKVKTSICIARLMYKTPLTRISSLKLRRQPVFGSPLTACKHRPAQ